MPGREVGQCPSQLLVTNEVDTESLQKDQWNTMNNLYTKHKNLNRKYGKHV